MTTDMYMVLEVQGLVYGVPTYDRKARELRFKVSSSGGATLPLIATGETAKAFKSLLNSGVLIQASAVPMQEVIDHNGGKAVVSQWHVKRIQVLSYKKVRLKGFEDLRILDGLMPEDDDYEDVGHVDPESWGRFSTYRESMTKKGDGEK